MYNGRFAISIRGCFRGGVTLSALTKKTWLIRDSGRLLDQEADQASQQRLTPLADVVNELEESQIQGQLLLRHPPVGTQPRSEQGPEPLDGVDMDFAEAVTILVAANSPAA